MALATVGKSRLPSGRMGRPGMNMRLAGLGVVCTWMKRDCEEGGAALNALRSTTTPAGRIG